jgi:hypothetical protein
MNIEPRRLRDMPHGAEYLDGTGARARVDALLLATNGVDLNRVVPAIVPNDAQYEQQKDMTPQAMLTLLQAGFTFDVLEVSES